MTHASATVDMMQPPYPAERGLDVYNTKLGMWVFLASEVMFFAALIGTYVILRFGAPGEWARPGIVLNIKVTAFITFLLICSSVSMVKAYASIQDGDRQKMRFWLLMTILGGATFVGIQVYEYTHLVERGFLPSRVREGSELAELAAPGTLPAAELALAFELPISRNLKLVLLLFLAVWKALLVALFFMHLKFERWNLRIMAIIPLPLALIFLFAAMSEHVW